MAFGYSIEFVNRVNALLAADPDNPVFQLGKLCIDNNIMLAAVAGDLGMSKQGVYKWFSQEAAPRPDTLAKIDALVKKLQKQQAKKTGKPTKKA